MAIKYPYTDFHEMNLDWILSQMKNLDIRMENFTEEVKEEILPIVQQAIEEGLIDIAYDDTTNTIIMVPGAGVTSADIASYFQIGDTKYPVADAEARSTIDYLSTYVTPQMYGAKADGVTDDTDAINTALANGGTILFPSGTYIITGPLEVISNSKILGTGNSIIKIKRTDNTWKELSFCLGVYGSDSATGYDGVHDVTIENIILDGGYNQYFTGTGYGGGNIGMAHCQNVQIKNCSFRNMVNDHYIDIAGCKNIIVDGCTFADIIVTGTASYEAINIDFCSQAGFPHFGTWDSTPCENVVIIGCTFKDLKSHAFGIGCHYVTADQTRHKEINITSCSFNGCSLAVKMMFTDDFRFNNNSVVDCGYHYTGEASPYVVFLQNVSGAIINNNNFRDIIYGVVKAENNGGSDTQYIDDIIISGNTFYNFNTGNSSFDGSAVRMRYYNYATISNNIFVHSTRLTTLLSYVNKLIFTGNYSSGSDVTWDFNFDNINNATLVFNRNDGTNANYAFGGTNSNVIRQLNNETTFTTI